MTQGVGMMSNMAVCVCVLCAKLRGQKLTMCHQSRGPSSASAQMFQVVDRLIKQTQTIWLGICQKLYMFMLSHKLYLCQAVSINESTSKACWILSLLPAKPGRLELKECVFSEICPPSRLSSGSKVSDHNLHTPSSQDVSRTLHTEPLGHNRERNLLTLILFAVSNIISIKQMMLSSHLLLTATWSWSGSLGCWNLS